ncbi:DUF305 domain-containing protein [Paenarthrobacter sp. PH39-S1]|uniref:DUF305 domain-containing protein n=1 Tax=Paenarthrobacter sp. PH39-S1 TaxID=3046204 RepID=UPI0024B89BF0|nr:DUF305 domain-containing protein [Paenarthrobacter sp. PH39-S1]MDJ0354561.1 DUF305 domain-containing protein [Paenarthrobacter sp. PH39-S1]
MKKFLTISSTAVAAAIALAGCSAGTDGGSMPGMDHGGSSAGSTSTSAGDSAMMAGAERNSADTTFAQMMTPHHLQAVDMSNLLLAKQGIDPRVSALATKIKAAQAPEIEKMTGWLAAWKEPTAMSGMSGTSGMTGTMSDEEMKKLDAAQGAEAAKLYLSQMVTHHEGAVEMAKAEVIDGKNADAVALAKSIVSTQESEIKEMQDLLTTL